jgi:hypothetical protein
MIIVFKILTGEEIIGVLDCNTDEEFEELESYDLIDPMWIVPGERGTLKLRDALMLGENETLIFIPETIITCYKPSKSLVNYYSRAIDYSKNFVRKEIDEQINTATGEMEDILREESQGIAKLANALLKIPSTKLH